MISRNSSTGGFGWRRKKRFFFSGCRNVYNPGKSTALIIIFNII
ncbi:hypothetical protein A676_02724 [Salmonella enterica subsp. enterica serovar Enteritidis str. 2010K-0262]|uniref:Uncharacterized protein n=1 Tax=Salmonella enteritidis (strain 2009K0958) TaxID=1192586 RepID=A0A656ID58_SALE2|nr:hypothetical protein A673_03455 [Salmonella enterica subsp. enterica serovar Enteritidis str. 2009K0958]EPI73049.1 hypothetical protein A672_02062 [Salmonella enterica subsp. enterica serovar Enteritidis str. 08-1080]EPI81985.1 hypothetical protein A676_02724 [Salmonella enterica subsp. enterica serovar Enteritidis str. 2010K-0262]EPI86922.1 hypothetical protein A675_01950 [Salmonella enterica subsp. enterica serovar Enteritidis str. 2009K1726]EPI89819.1 hypothetical protein A674_00743 [Salm